MSNGCEGGLVGHIICRATFARNANCKFKPSSKSSLDTVSESAVDKENSRGGLKKATQVESVACISISSDAGRLTFIRTGRVYIVDLTRPKSEVNRVKLETYAESFAWSTSGKWLVIGDSRGYINFVLPSTWEVLLSKRVCTSRQRISGAVCIPAMCFREQIEGSGVEELL